jgi:hypothetical protein
MLLNGKSQHKDASKSGLQFLQILLNEFQTNKDSFLYWSPETCGYVKFNKSFVKYVDCSFRLALNLKHPS